MALLVERNTLLTWRIIQFCLLLMMLILEIAQLVGYHYYYWDQPANDQIQIWISEAISFAIMGYILVHFNSRWKNGPYKEEMVLDWILFTTWSLQCYLNMGPVLFGKGLNCNIKTNKYNITTSGGQARCHLFIGDIILSYFIFFTTIATLTMSVLRWKNRKIIKPSLTSCDKLKSPYLIEKGLLSNGEPVLFFYSRNMHPNSINSYKLRNSMVKTSESSPLSSPVNIEIPEPELAATSARVNDFEILAPKDSQK